MAVDTYALTSLANVKTYLGITASTDDTLLEDLIDAMSMKIEAYLGFNVLSREYREWRDGRDMESIVLRHFPVTAVKRVGYGSQSAFSIHATTSDDIRATVEVQDDRFIFSRFDSAGTETATSRVFSSSVTTSAMVTYINTITGWSATLVENMLCLDLHRMAGIDALDQTAYATFPSYSARDIHVDEARGILGIRDTDPFWTNEWYNAGFPPGRQNVLVQYTAGYGTIPYYIEQVCIKLVQMAYGSRGQRDTTVQSESEGDYSYTLASRIELDDEMKVQLEDFRDIR